MTPYWKRALKSRDPRYARILSRLGYATRHMQAGPSEVEVVAPVPDPAPEVMGELSALRARYQEVIGKRPYHGWGAEDLRKRIDEALAS